MGDGLGGPRVSVVIITYNRAGLLPRAVRSVLGQSYPPWEVLIVDDASTDHTPAVVAGLRREDARVRLVSRAHNGGCGAARATGFAAAEGDLVAFLDSDDLWDPDHLATATRFLADCPDLDLVGADVRHVRDDGTVVCPAFLRQRKDIGRFLAADPSGPGRFRFAVPERAALLQDHLCIIVTVVLWRARTRGHQFDEAISYCDEWDFLLRLALDGKRFGFLDRASCDVYLHGENQSRKPTPRDPADRCRMWSKVLERPDTDAATRRQLRARIAGLRVWEGYEHLRGGNRAAARGAFWRSLRNHFTWTGVRGLVGATLVPRRLTARV